MNTFLAKSGASNGVGLWCDDCRRFVTKERGHHTGWALPASHLLLQGVDRSTLPRVHALSVECEICERTTIAPELHHWCPRAIYAETPIPNEGPQAWLCRECHMTWHQMVTPGLLPLDALELVRALYRRLRKRPGAWRAFVRTVIDADAKVQRQMPSQRTESAA